MYLSISAFSGELCTGSLGDSIASIVAPPEICGSRLGDEKDTACCCRNRDEELNEEEEPRKHIRAETITKSLDPPGTVSVLKMLPQTGNQCSKVDVKHGKLFWCAICDNRVKIQYDRDFTIGRWGGEQEE